MLDYEYIRSQVKDSEIPDYEHSKLKEQADDIKSHVIAELEKSGKEQRKFNIALTIIGLLTLFFTAYGVFFK